MCSQICIRRSVSNVASLPTCEQYCRAAARPNIEQGPIWVFPGCPSGAACSRGRRGQPAGSCWSPVGGVYTPHLRPSSSLPTNPRCVWVAERGQSQHVVASKACSASASGLPFWVVLSGPESSEDSSSSVALSPPSKLFLYLSLDSQPPAGNLFLRLIQGTP
jgi:hypothetical protein